MPKFMGDFAKWDDYLTTVWDHGYNYIHFTPLQKIGKSKSPYSISDQLELESSQFEEINTFLESWKRKLGFVTDVVWNHTANDSKWLKEREIQKFKNKNSRKKVFEMLTTGEFINSEKAYSLGLVNRIAPLEDLTIETLKLAKTIESKLSSAVKIGKEAFYKQIEMPIEMAYKYTSKIMAENMITEDAKEGISSFIKKKPPIWKNK